MLESSVWRQYNSENNFRQMLSQFCNLEIQDIISDDKALYGVLKSKLTKKELKLFAMDTAKIADTQISAALGIEMQNLVQAKFKLYKKLKQDKTKLNFKEMGFCGTTESE